jgi:hypothetical protein
MCQRPIHRVFVLDIFFNDGDNCRRHRIEVWWNCVCLITSSARPHREGFDACKHFPLSPWTSGTTRPCCITGHWNLFHSAFARRQRGTCRSLIVSSEIWNTGHRITHGFRDYGLGRRRVSSIGAAMESHLDCGIDCYFILGSVYFDTAHVPCKDVVAISQCFVVGAVWQFCVWRLLSMVFTHGGNAGVRV